MAEPLSADWLRHMRNIESAQKLLGKNRQPESKEMFEAFAFDIVEGLSLADNVLAGAFSDAQTAATKVDNVVLEGLIKGRYAEYVDDEILAVLCPGLDLVNVAGDLQNTWQQITAIFPRFARTVDETSISPWLYKAIADAWSEFMFKAVYFYVMPDDDLSTPGINYTDDLKMLQFMRMWTLDSTPINEHLAMTAAMLSADAYLLPMFSALKQVHRVMLQEEDAMRARIEAEAGADVVSITNIEMMGIAPRPIKMPLVLRVDGTTTVSELIDAAAAQIPQLRGCKALDVYKDDTVMSLVSDDENWEFDAGTLTVYEADNYVDNSLRAAARSAAVPVLQAGGPLTLPGDSGARPSEVAATAFTMKPGSSPDPDVDSGPEEDHEQAKKP